MMEYVLALWELISDNAVVSAIVSALVVAFIFWLINRSVKNYRSNRVYKILQRGLVEKNKRFLPTTYLSSKSGYTQSEVEGLCSSHEKIRRNERQRESWCID